jgi:hypothetical protein
MRIKLHIKKIKDKITKKKNQLQKSSQVKNKITTRIMRFDHLKN